MLQLQTTEGLSQQIAADWLSLLTVLITAVTLTPVKRTIQRKHRRSALLPSYMEQDTRRLPLDLGGQILLFPFLLS